MKYAVIQTGGKQYKISEGSVLEVERLSEEAGKDVLFNEVLLYTADGVTKVGQPFVSDITVFGKVIDHIRGEKLRIAKYKAKARYRRVTGHRQALTKIMIETIGTEADRKNKKTSEPAVSIVKNEISVATPEKKEAKPKTIKKASEKKEAVKKA